MSLIEKGIRMKIVIGIVLIGFGISAVTGCVMTSRNKLPGDMKSKEQIWKEHFKGQAHRASYQGRGTRSYHEDDPSHGFSFVRHSKNETRALFKRLPNPDLVLYVFPHVKGPEQTPVPGYTTVFPMYTEVHYAMPGEVPVRTPVMKPLKVHKVHQGVVPEKRNYNRAHPKTREAKIIRALYR